MTMLADVPMVFILIGITAYTVLSGADFGAGLWTLVPGGGQAGAAATRDHTRHAIGPVWEANHVWLIFVLTVAWTCYPVPFGSIVSTLAVPLLIAAIGIIFRGTAYALRSQFSRDEERGVRLVEYLFALSSVLTPFALATVIGAIATGRVPVGNARGDLFDSAAWLNPVSVLAGVLAVAFSGYLAAVYLAADARRLAERALVHDFRLRALASGVVAGALALAGLLVIRVSAGSLWHGLTSGLGLALVIVSALAGVVTMVLVFAERFGPSRASAALAVAAVIAGWAAAQSPQVLPGLTVAEAAAGRSTLIATIVGVAVGAVVLVPSLAVLYSLVLRGRLDTVVAADGAAASVGVGTGAAASGGVGTGAAHGRVPRVPLAAAVAIAALVAGTGLLVFADPAWAHAIGAVALIACAVTVFGLASGPAGELPGRQAESGEHAAGEAGHRLDAVAAEGEHEQAVRPRVLGSGRFAQVGGEGELAVGPGGDDPVGAPVPERDLGQEAGDRVVALVLQRRRRHGQPGVVAEQGGDAVHVAGLVGAGEPLDELLLPGGSRGRGRVGGARGVVAQGRAGALERAGHGLLGGAEDAGRLAGGEPEHVAQDQHGPLPRRQPLHRGDEGQRDRLVGLVPGLGAGCGVGQVLERVVREGLEPGHLAEPGRLGRRGPGRHYALAAPGRAPHVQAAGGGDPVQPGPDRGAPLEARDALPRS
jgi:cytochrome d ubiquinol oxidase subunit II